MILSVFDRAATEELSIVKDLLVDEVAKWPLITVDTIFLYILNKNDILTQELHRVLLSTKAYGQLLKTAWRSCMTGANEACSHVIATFYKMEYANIKRLVVTCLYRCCM